MTEIKFSNHYLKLTAVSGKVKLLQAIKVNFAELSNDFIEYDTKYMSNGKWEYYKLPKSGFGILLIFKTNNNKIFTTVRRFVEYKWDYYKKNQGNLFDIVYIK